MERQTRIGQRVRRISGLTRDGESIEWMGQRPDDAPGDLDKGEMARSLV
jgi:hypothetical protein